MVNGYTIFFIAVLLVSADKIITYMNIKAVERNFPKINPIQIEKNPLAKFFFQKAGLIWGSILYGIFSVGTFIFALYLFYFPAKIYSPTNAWGISLYVMMIAYSFVIMNNLYFLLRYNKLL